jgi:hypothetical protein
MSKRVGNRPVRWCVAGYPLGCLQGRSGAFPDFENFVARSCFSQLSPGAMYRRDHIVQQIQL